MKTIHLVILASLIAFGSLGAVAITPTMPLIASTFNISEEASQQLISLYLLGYALGQLIYGPICKGCGSKFALNFAIFTAFLGCVISLVSGYFGNYQFILVGRVITAIGGAGGLKMCFTLVNYLCDPKDSSKSMGWLTLAFAGVPGLGIFVCGLLSSILGWGSAFWLIIVYCLVILKASSLLPEVISQPDKKALKLRNVFSGYFHQLKDQKVVAGGFLIGTATGLSYIFNSIVPNIAMLDYHLTALSFANYNFIPLFGIISGAFAANFLVTRFSSEKLVFSGIVIAILGGGILIIANNYNLFPMLAMFTGGMVINFGMSFVFACSSSLALANSEDKANASAIMSFINMAYAFAATVISGMIGNIMVAGLGAILILVSLLGLLWLILVRVT